LLTLESAQIGLTFGRIAASGAVAFKELILAQIRPSLFGTFDYVCVTHEEALSSFDRNGCASDHPEFVEAVTGIGDAIVRHEGTSHRENTCDEFPRWRVTLVRVGGDGAPSFLDFFFGKAFLHSTGLT